MSTGNEKTKYPSIGAKGTGGPEGLIGKRGFTYEDELTDDGYESLGDDKWRKTVHEGIPLLSRRLPMQLLPIDFENLVVGETIYLEDRKANFKVIGKQKKSLKLNSNSDYTKYSTYKCSDFPSIIFEAGDTVEIDFIMNSYSQSLSAMYFLYINGDYNLSMLRTGKIVRPYERAYSGITYELFDRNGKREKLQYATLGKWQKIIITFNQTVTSSSSLGIGLLEGNPVNYKGRECDFNFKNIKISRNNSGFPEIDYFQVEDYDTVTGFLHNQNNDKKFTTIASQIASDVELQEVEVMQISTNMGDILQLIIDDNVITPENFGYKSNLNLDFTNSISPYLQKCVETGRTIHVAGGFHYWDEPIEFTKNQIIMFDGADIDADEKSQSDTTFFYTDKAVDFARIFTNMIISGGVVSYKTFLDPENYPGILNPVAYRIIPLGEMYNLQIRDINVVNVRQRLRRGADIGCIGILFDVGVGGFKDPIYNDHPNPLFGTLYGGVSRLFISGTFEGLNYSIKFPKYVPEYSERPIRGWHNSVTVKANSHNAKVHIYINSGNIYSIDLQEQDFSALVDSERTNYANYLNATNITHDIFMYDGDNKNSDSKDTWTHLKYNIFSKDKDNTAVGKSLIGYNLDFINIVNSNRNTIINDPERLVLSDFKKNMISKLDNQIRYSGFLPSFSMKGYVMPNDINHFPTGNAASIIPVASTNGWVNEVGNPNVTVEEIDGVNTIKITPAPGITSESSAKIKINAIIGEKYRLSFDYKVGIGQAQKMRLVGASQLVKISRAAGVATCELNYNLGHKEFTSQEHLIIAESNEVWIVFEAITGDVIKVRDKFINEIVESKNTVPNGSIRVNSNFFIGKTYKIVMETIQEVGDKEVVEFDFTCTDDQSARFISQQITETMKLSGLTGWSAGPGGGWVIEIFIPKNTYRYLTTFKAYQYGDESYTVNVKNLKITNQWWDNNLFPCHLSLNTMTDPLEANASDVSIVNNDLLKENKLQNTIELKNKRGFGEIFCELREAEKVTRVLSAHKSGAPKLIQAILYDYNMQVASTQTLGYDNEILNSGTYDLFDKSWVERHSSIKYVTFRFMFPKEDRELIMIDDLMIATQYSLYDPVINGSGGYIHRSSKGFTSELGMGNGHKWNDTDVVVNIKSNTTINLKDYKTTIILNNATDSSKTLTIDKVTKEFAGRKYKLIAPIGKYKDHPNGIGEYKNISDIVINISSIYSLDGENIIMKPGDVIEVEVVQTEPVYGRCQLFQVSGSSPKYKNLESKNLKVTETLLSPKGVIDNHVWSNSTVLPYSYVGMTGNIGNLFLGKYTDTVYVNATADNIPILSMYSGGLRNHLGRTFTIYATKSTSLNGVDMVDSKPFQIQVLVNNQGIVRMDDSEQYLVMRPGDFIQLKVMDFGNTHTTRAKLMQVGGNTLFSKNFKTNLLDLNSPFGNIFNIDNKDKKDFKHYVISRPIKGAKARILINSPVEPVVWNQRIGIFGPFHLIEVNNLVDLPIIGVTNTTYRTKNDGELYLWNITSYILYLQQYVSRINFPVIGINGIQYRDIDTGIIYVWNGVTYLSKSDVLKSFTSQSFKPNTDMYLNVWVEDFEKIRYAFEGISTSVSTIDITSFTSMETIDTKTNISLITVGGNLCNMRDANTNELFTNTGNVLNAFAEILINTVNQPIIKDAIYKSNKGIAFISSENMIMRVENKGFPRGVQYWFEEF